MAREVYLGDCREVLKALPDSSVDSCVTDPPYELGFMNRAWDSTNTWLTPKPLLDALGPFDLDPCSAPDPKPWPTAAHHYTFPAEDGLALPWEGSVFCNPPYGPNTGRWLAKCADHGDAIALVFARTETRAFVDHVWGRADAALFLSGRVRFCRPDGAQGESAGAPSVLVAYGPAAVERLRRCGLPGQIVTWERSR